MKLETETFMIKHIFIDNLFCVELINNIFSKSFFFKYLFCHNILFQKSLKNPLLCNYAISQKLKHLNLIILKLKMISK